jgi:hypothetical protein
LTIIFKIDVTLAHNNNCEPAKEHNQVGINPKRGIRKRSDERQTCKGILTKLPNLKRGGHRTREGEVSTATPKPEKERNRTREGE